MTLFELDSNFHIILNVEYNKNFSKKVSKLCSGGKGGRDSVF